MDCMYVWGHKESDSTERLSLSLCSPMCSSSSSLSTLLQASQRCPWSAVSSAQVPFLSLWFLPASSPTIHSCQHHRQQPGDTFRFHPTSPPGRQQTTPSFPSTQFFFVSVTLHSFDFLLSFFTGPEVCSLPR